MKIHEGDYVLATKYKDGDPKDHFCVGYFKDMTWHGRYNIVDSEGRLFRHNGFRRARRVRAEIGNAIINHMNLITSGDRSVWSWLRQFERDKSIINKG